VRRLVLRFLGWHIRTYGMWAYRHEPLSLAIYPLVTALGPVVVWLAIGLRSAIWFFVVAELFMFGFIYLGLRRRRARRASSP
jgi:hypothetical protein